MFLTSYRLSWSTIIISPVLSFSSTVPGPQERDPRSIRLTNASDATRNEDIVQQSKETLMLTSPTCTCKMWGAPPQIPSPPGE